MSRSLFQENESMSLKVSVNKEEQLYIIGVNTFHD